MSSFVGIYTFLHYIESKILNEKKVTLTENTLRPGGVVTLMTIHASKGLEFPVCFVARCGNSKRDKLSSADLVFEKGTGVSLKFYDREEHRKYDNGLRRIAAQIRLNQEKEEEMRILYVAMTRAREYLYLVGFKSDTRAPFVKGDRFNALTAGSYMEWIRAGMQAHPEILPYCDVQEVSENSIERVYVQIQDASEEIAADFSAGMEKYRQLHRMRAEISPIEELLRSVPTKVPASRMTDMLLDECVYYTSDLSAGDEDKIPVSERMAPLFDVQSKENIRRSLMLMSHGSSSDEFELLLKANSRPTAAEKGTAAHMFLQYCNWKAVYERGLEEEICRLREEGFITERIVTILDRKQLAAFFESDFAKRAYTATHMERELKFQRFIPLRTQTTHQALADALGDRTLYVRGSIDLLCEKFTPDEVGITLDTYWVQAAGGDPAAWIRKLKGRLDRVHFKDMSFNLDDKAIRIAPIGDGNMNYDSIIEACNESDVEIAYVELDNCYGADPFESLKRSYEYLSSRYGLK